MIQNVILFDLGATKTRVALMRDSQNFGEPIVFQTGNDYSEWQKNIESAVKKLLPNEEVGSMIGGATRSAFGGDYDKLESDLAIQFGTKVKIENDAALAALGEANFGAGRGFNIVAYLTVSTGVGGARVVGGRLDEKAYGFEPGRQIIALGEAADTLEELISGKALEKRLGKSPKEVDDQNIWDDLAKKLAVGLNNIIVEWSPEVVVLGGSMITGDPAISIMQTENYLKEFLQIGKLPAIKKAELGDFGGLWGGLTYLTPQPLS